MVGRVGDTPQVGSGGYCDDRAGACSATGHGESIARVVLCRHITGLMADGGLEPKPAAELALQYMKVLNWRSDKCGVSQPWSLSLCSLIFSIRDI